MSEEQRKQIPLRVSSELFAAIAKWAEEDFRSINGQIEYLLNECVKQHRKHGRYSIDENEIHEKDEHE